MSNNYLKVLYDILDDNFSELSEQEKEEIKKIIQNLIEAESKYEFNEDRPLIETLLDNLIK